MTQITKKYLITTEKHEVCVISNNRRSINIFCDNCGHIVEMWNLYVATANTGIHTRKIFNLLEKNEIHSFETADGHLFVCKRSLFERGKL
jgi:hypothetical protein